MKIDFSYCLNCKKYTVWKDGAEIYPLVPRVQHPHADMPDDVKAIYWEAARVVRASPRAAAVLIRCALQMLLTHMGQSTGKLMSDITTLERGVFDAEVIMALDLVRLLGDDGAHPNQIMLGQTVKDADDLFFLLNYIADTQYERLRKRKRVAEMHGTIPEPQKTYIADRQRGNARLSGKQQST